MKAMVVYKADGTQDTIMWQQDSGSYFYGKENPVEGDYINGDISINEYNYRLTYSCNLTSVVSKYASESVYGFILSSSSIDGLPEGMRFGGWSNGNIIFADKMRWYSPDSSYSLDDGEGYVVKNIFNEDAINLTTGNTYYGRAFLVLDDKVYFSKEQTFVVQ